MLPFAYLSKRILPCKMWGIGMCFSSAATPAPGRIYTQRELFEVKKAMMTSNNPESYALASAFMNHRADRPSNYKPDVPMGRFIQPSLKEKRLLVLTRIYKRVSDIPESIRWEILASVLSYKKRCRYNFELID
ncbi:unnamed protein product [Thelazia callipaeda]|uniref:Uncharacterized protein n=1 Tax=Thelazia callipaeda TaxID=103827 RepID=A0A0N5CNE3_THECL|nr:unnamed protein product [Thelazia callipaeda]